MDMLNVIKNLEDEVSCKICLEHFVDPKQLPCLHSFCLKCVNALAERNAQKNRIECPTCRTEVNIPKDGTFAGFPSSFYLNNLLDVLAIKKSNTVGIKCDNCNQTTNQGSYCFDCRDFLCHSKCLPAHNILKVTKNHRVLELEQTTEEQLQDVIRSLPYCEEKHHEKEILKFFCTNCKLSVCRDCVVIGHNQHQVVHLTEVADKANLQISSAVTKGKEKVREYANAVQVIEKRLEKIKDRADDSRINIQGFFEDMVSRLLQKKEDLLRQVDCAVQDFEKLLIEQKRNLLEESKELSNFLDHTEIMRQRSTNAEIFNLKQTVENKLNFLMNKEAKVSADTMSVCFHPAKELEEIISREGIGCVKESFVTHPSISWLSYGFCKLTTTAVQRTGQRHEKQCFQCIQPEVEIVSSLSGKVVPHRLQDNHDGTFDVHWRCVKDPKRHKMHVKSHGQEIFGSPFALLCSNSEFVPVYWRKYFFQPWAITVDNNNEIIVSDVINHKVQVLNSGRGFTRNLCSKPLKTPAGVVCDEYGNVFIADAGNNKIHVCKQNGDLIRSFLVSVSDNKKPPRLQGLSLDSKGNLIVVDSNNSTVQIHEQRGRLVLAFTTLTGRGKVSCPVHCVSGHGQYYVSDEAENCIKVYDSNGKFKCEFGKAGFSLESFNRPRGLAIDPKGRLVVCDSSNDRIMFFDIKRNPSRLVGLIGDDYEETRNQLDSPVFLTFMKEGKKFAVTNYNACTIQIFEKK